MSKEIYLSRILVYPIKSLDGVEVQQAALTTGGILENDRVWAMRDATGKFVNAKRDARVQLLRSNFSADVCEIRLWQTGSTSHHQFVLHEPERLNAWLSDYFGFPIHLEKDRTRGFPDDEEANGPTLTSEASLVVVSGWFGITLESARWRFRTNLELSNAPAFYEDSLFGAPGERKAFQLGTVHILGHNPCQRCIVPVRDPNSAEPISGFQKEFAELRRSSLPPWTDRRPFNHYYRFALNTSVPADETGKTLRSGDILHSAPCDV